MEETKNVVRRKLGLDTDAAITLAQLRENKRIDLEDGACGHVSHVDARTKRYQMTTSMLFVLSPMLPLMQIFVWIQAEGMHVNWALSTNCRDSVPSHP